MRRWARFLAPQGRELKVEDVLREDIPQVPRGHPHRWRLPRSCRIRACACCSFMHHAGGIAYPAGILTYRHILRFLAASSPEELRDLGIQAARNLHGGFLQRAGRWPGRRYHVTSNRSSFQCPLKSPKKNGRVRCAPLPWAPPRPRVATRSQAVTVGGEKTLPFLHFEGEIPHRPVVAVEIKDHSPADWSRFSCKPGVRR